jgi:hypothetical protein
MAAEKNEETKRFQEAREKQVPCGCFHSIKSIRVARGSSLNDKSAACA